MLNLRLAFSATTLLLVALTTTTTATAPSGCPEALHASLENMGQVIEETYNTTHNATAIQQLFTSSVGLLWFDGSPVADLPNIPSFVSRSFATVRAVSVSIRECNVFHVQTQFSASWVIFDMDLFTPEGSVTHASFLAGVTYEGTWRIMFIMGLPVTDGPPAAGVSSSSSLSSLSSLRGLSPASPALTGGLRGNTDINITKVLDYRLHALSDAYAKAAALKDVSPLASFYTPESVLQAADFPVLQGWEGTGGASEYYTFLLNSPSQVTGLQHSFQQGGFVATDDYVFCLTNWVASSNGFNVAVGQSFIVWNVDPGLTDLTIHRHFQVTV